MKHFYLLSLLLLLAASCSKSDSENNAETQDAAANVYSFDDQGGLVINTKVESHTAKDFEAKVSGKCWRCISLNRIKADGTVEKEQYLSDLSGTYATQYFFEMNHTFTYEKSDAFSGMICRNLQTAFDETTGNITDRNGKKLLTVVSINADNTLTTVVWGYNGDIVQGVYRSMTDEEYAQLQRISIEPNVSMKYAYDNDGQPIATTDAEKHSAGDFEEKVCGWCWKIIACNKIESDGTVAAEPYFSDMGGFVYRHFYFEKGRTIRYIHSDSNPFPVSQVLQTTFDEATGNVVDADGNKVVTIVSINADNTITALDGSGFIQLTYYPMTTKEYEQYKQSETQTPSSSPKIYSFDENGQLVIPGTAEGRSASLFAEKVCGKCWRCVDLHKINADGTLDKGYYLHMMDGGSPNHYAFETGSVTHYWFSDADPAWFRQTVPSNYDEESGNVTDANGYRFLTIVSINADGTLTAIDWLIGTRGDIVQATYRPMTAEGYAQFHGQCISLDTEDNTNKRPELEL